MSDLEIDVQKRSSDDLPPRPVGFVSLVTGEIETLYVIPPDRSSDTKSSGGVSIAATSMPTLQELLERNQVAYTLLHEPIRGSAGGVDRATRVWVALWSVGVVWGVLFGVGLAYDEFFVSPVTSLAGITFTLVLVVTLVRWSKDRGSGSQSDGWRRRVRA